MPGVKGRTGLHGRQGRKQTSVRRLVQPAPELQFDMPVTAHTDICGFGFCPYCGAAWWDAHVVDYRQGKAILPDGNGDMFPILATEQRAAQPERHSPTCPNRG